MRQRQDKVEDAVCGLKAVTTALRGDMTEVQADLNCLDTEAQRNKKDSGRDAE